MIQHILKFSHPPPKLRAAGSFFKNKQELILSIGARDIVQGLRYFPQLNVASSNFILNTV